MFTGILLKNQVKEESVFVFETSQLKSNCSSLEEFIHLNLSKNLVSFHHPIALFVSGQPTGDVFTQQTNKSKSIRQVLKEEYFKKGIGFVNDLSGDWTLMLWDTSKQKLTLARDKTGTKSIYFYENNNTIIFSNELSSLLQLQFIPKSLNQSTLIKYSSKYRRDDETIYKGINRLMGGHLITFQNKTSQLINYWRPSRTPSIFYKKQEEYLLHFEELYQQAVADSVKNFKNIGIALSSGFDSSSILAYATRYLENKGQSIDAITWRPNVVDKAMNSKNRIQDESIMVKELTKMYPNVNLHVVTSQQNTILEGLRKLVTLCHQPNFTLTPHIQEVQEYGSTLGIDMMLNGHLGNYTVSWYSPKLLFDKTQPSFFIYWMNYIGRKAKNFVNQPDLRIRFAKRSYPHHGAFIRQEAIQEHLDKVIISDFDKFRTSSDIQIKLIANAMQVNLLGDASEYTEGLGYESRSPAMDDRIVEFCLKIPQSVYGVNGENKALIKSVMKGKIPNNIINNKKRGEQGANSITKLKHEYKAICQLLEEFKASKFISYWVDIEGVQQHLDFIVNPSLTRLDFTLKVNLGFIFRGITTGLFLQNFEKGIY